MRRSLVLAAVGLAATLTLSGCEVDGTPYAARVGSSSISSSALQSTMSSIAGNKVSRCLFGGTSIAGAGSGTYAMTFASTVLTFMIEENLVDTEVNRLGLTTTSLAKEASANLLAAALASPAETCAPGVSDVDAELPPRFRSVLNGYETAQAVLAAHLAHTSLTTASLTAYAAANPLATSVACVSEIVLSSESQAASVAAKARNGVSFAALAKADSLDTSTSSNGGALGCGPPSDFPSEYSTAILSLPTHAISDPIALASPYYGIVTVTSRQPGSTLDAALGAITAGSVGLDSLLNHLSSSDVSIDSSYGHWTYRDGAYAVVAPSGPPARYITNVAALTPPSTSSSSSSSSS